jgi:hypothetical protein
VLNVAKPINLFGISEVANPAAAHTGYDYDDRVIAIIANGFGHANTKQIVKDRCEWLETISSSPAS